MPRLPPAISRPGSLSDSTHAAKPRRQGKAPSPRLVFVDTETTGLHPAQGHRIIEVACVEVCAGRVTGREYHTRIFPERSVPVEAIAVHGIDDAMLRDHPRFATIATELQRFVADAVTVMHHRPFDTGFFAAEFERLGIAAPSLTQPEEGIDTLPRFRAKHPGARCSLSALCERYGIALEAQEGWHGALTDARMLARLWLASEIGIKGARDAW